MALSIILHGRAVVFECLQFFLHLFTQHIADFADPLQTVVHHLFGVVFSRVVVALNSHVHNWFRRVRHRVSAELYVGVLYNLVSEQVAQSVIFIVESISGIVPVTVRSFDLQLRRNRFLVLFRHLVDDLRINLHFINLLINLFISL